MAVEAQSGLFMAALITEVTYACPWCTLAGGCSLSACEGVTHMTEEAFPVLASAKKLFRGWTLRS